MTKQTAPIDVADDAAERWQAVVSRDARFDGTFVCAVRSTGIYCRPSCSSRLPKRSNVTFFPVAEAAEQMGFRACLRCRPDRTPSEDPALDAVRRACRAIAEHEGDRPITLAQLGGSIGVSPFHLHRLFKRAMGITPRQFADSLRLRRFKSGLRRGSTVTDALYEAGYGSSSRLYEGSSEQLGMTPASYRRGGRQAAIRYTVVGCRLGRLLVAATDVGICAVRLGDDEAALEAGLREEYSAAELSRSDRALEAWVDLLLRHLAGETPHPDLPLDVKSTAFERLVWDHLRTIPRGETRSYGQIAEAIGRPGAARAVGSACAANPVALLFPCHRAVRKDGGLGGYRWGLGIKGELLSMEREVGEGQGAGQE